MGGGGGGLRVCVDVCWCACVVVCLFVRLFVRWCACVLNSQKGDVSDRSQINCFTVSSGKFAASRLVLWSSPRSKNVCSTDATPKRFYTFFYNLQGNDVFLVQQPLSDLLIVSVRFL